MSTPTLPPMAQRVAAGAALLDQAWPGWHTTVDPGRLDLAAEDCDLLAQLYGSYFHGLDALATIDHRAITRPCAWAARHGFDLAPGEPKVCYADLTRCWQALVAGRQRGRYPARPTSAASLRARAARGAKLMDRHQPGWHRQVDPDTLDAADTGRCVLGQVFGGFEPGLAELTACQCPEMAGYRSDPAAWTVVHGFDLDVAESRADFLALGRAWQAELARRRGGDPR